MRYRKYKKIIKSLEEAYKVVLANSNDLEKDWKFVLDGVCEFTSYTFKVDHADHTYNFFYVNCVCGDIRFYANHWKLFDNHPIVIKPKLGLFGNVILSSTYVEDYQGIIPSDIEKNVKEGFIKFIDGFVISHLEYNLRRLKEIRALKDFGL